MDPRPHPKKFVLYLPTAIAVHAELIHAVELILCRRFGGLTRFRATGLFQRKSGRIERENIDVLECFGELENWAGDAPFLQGLAAVLASRMEQEAIACSVDGRMHFVDAENDSAGACWPAGDLELVCRHLVQVTESIAKEVKADW